MNISPISDVHPSESQLRPVLSDASVDLLQRLKEINTNYFWSNRTLANQLKEVKPIELNKILNCYFLEMVEENCIQDPVQFLDRLADIIPFESLQEAVKDNVEDALKEAQGMLEEAQFYLQMSKEKTSPGIRVRLVAILDGIISIIESIITAFGIGDFFKPAESDLHADFKSQKIMMLMSLFSMITTTILPLLGAATGGLIIGGTLLAIAALSAIWPWIKPKPIHLPANAENWTKQVQSKSFVAQGRKESLDEIAAILKMNRHAILVGPSRVGKSLTAKAFAQAIERGDYPELKGKTVFRINTTDLLDQQASLLGGGNNILNKISAAMGRHRNEIILVLDEIHMACKNDEKIADQLKTFLDEGGEFPHVIGITTEKEYDAHVKENHAFSLRFDRVNIKNTSPDETLKILSDHLLRNSSKPIIQEGVLNNIYDKSCEVEDAPQPAASLKLLKQCIHRTEKTQQSQTEKKITKISNKILSLRSQAAASRGRKKEAGTQIAKLKQEMAELQEALNKEKKELDKLFKSKELLDRVTKETYSLVLKISATAQTALNSKTEKQLKMFLFLHEFLYRSLESHIRGTSEKLGMKMIIDQNLIEEDEAVAANEEPATDGENALLEDLLAS